MTDKRQLYIKPSYVFGCLRDAAKHTARKRGTLQSSLSSTLQVTDDIIMVDRYVPEEPIPTDPTLPVFMDITSVRNPATRARNVRYRVASGVGWELAFHIMWDRMIVSRSEMEKVLQDAGQLVGLGDGRSIGYGRFEVVSFSINAD